MMNDRFKGWRLRRPSRLRRSTRTLRGGYYLPDDCTANAAEAGAAAAPTADSPGITSSIATLITRHILRDGEIVILLIKPSLWTIFFNSLPAVAVALIIMISTRLWAPHHVHIGAEAGLMLITLRALLAILAWSCKLYVLTDLRILRIWGVFNPQIHDVPLRKIARTRLVTSVHERLWRLGSIEIIPESDQWPWSVWQTIARPTDAHDIIRRAIARAKQGGCQGSTW